MSSVLEWSELMLWSPIIAYYVQGLIYLVLPRCSSCGHHGDSISLAWIGEFSSTFVWGRFGVTAIQCLEIRRLFYFRNDLDENNTQYFTNASCWWEEMPYLFSETKLIHPFSLCIKDVSLMKPHSYKSSFPTETLSCTDSHLKVLPLSIYRNITGGIMYKQFNINSVKCSRVTEETMNIWRLLTNLVRWNSSQT